jgi:hypothetical protein
METLYSVERRGDPKEWQIVSYDGQPGGEVIATCKSQDMAWRICGFLQSSDLPTICESGEYDDFAKFQSAKPSS